MLGIGSAACSSADKAESVKEQTTNTSTPYSPNRVEAKYFGNGTRTLIMIGGNYEHGGLKDIFEFCDGRDLVEETFTTQGASSVERSTDHRACIDDGKLTPEDFPSTPSKG